MRLYHLSLGNLWLLYCIVSNRRQWLSDCCRYTTMRFLPLSKKRLNVVINYKDFATLKQNKHEINTCLSYLCALYDFFVVLFSWMLRTLLSATSAAMLV